MDVHAYYTTFIIIGLSSTHQSLEFSLYSHQLGDLQVLEEDSFSEEEEIEDVHICGTCKIQFTSLDAFVEHKRTHHR